ncbi:ABC transporter permease [Streptomyces adelaidensis]|uniref:ABC transporter permease n=1 Tax=Streptomyces adelaidensis TaxID=2796465 RepID=UPI001F1F4B8B|nr:ABC transporter permease [Streptomyces adelaidensis]
MTASMAATITGPRTRRGPRGLTWAMLRLHFWAAVCWALLVLVAAGALLWAYGPGGDAASAEYYANACRDGVANPGCDDTAPAMGRYDTAITVGSRLITFAPLLVAVWAGAALIGRELENGTDRLAWTQSVTPARWLAAKLAVPAALLTSGTLLLVLLHRLMWSSHTGLWTSAGIWEWHESPIFVSNGPVAVAQVLLGLAVGVLAGLLTRRSLPALGYGFVVMTALLQALETLRPYLWPAKTATAPVTEDSPDYLGMTVAEGGLTPTGARVPNPCLTDEGCVLGRDVVSHYRDFHPSSHFWPLQLIETGIALAVTALLVLAAFHLLRRRTGGTP